MLPGDGIWRSARGAAEDTGYDTNCYNKWLTFRVRRLTLNAVSASRPGTCGAA